MSARLLSGSGLVHWADGDPLGGVAQALPDVKLVQGEDCGGGSRNQADVANGVCSFGYSQHCIVNYEDGAPQDNVGMVCT